MDNVFSYTITFLHLGNFEVFCSDFYTHSTTQDSHTLKNLNAQIWQRKNYPLKHSYAILVFMFL